MTRARRPSPVIGLVADVAGRPTASTKRFRATRPIPLYDEKMHMVRIAKPGSTGVVTDTYDVPIPGSRSARGRARVVFDGERQPWDVDRDSILMEDE